MQAPGAFADMTALRECWHPVTFAAELAMRGLGLATSEPVPR